MLVRCDELGDVVRFLCLQASPAPALVAVIWAYCGVGGARADTCTVGGGDLVPPPPRPFCVGEGGFAR